MHTFKGGSGTNFHYNSDFSGEVIIKQGEAEIKVQAYEILEFVGYCYILPMKTRKLEEMDYKELFKEDL